MADIFNFQSKRKNFAVIGNPISHSLSPRIHKLFAAQFDIKLEYDCIQAEPGGFESAISHFAARRGAGLNVTVPFKVAAWKLCKQVGNHLTARADHAQAVNTLNFLDHEIRGDNTDGIGLVRDMKNNLQWQLTGQRILILGAGGAARGIILPLSECRPKTLTIVNRTPHKARDLAAQFKNYHNLCGLGYDQLGGEFDIIINATSAGLSDQVVPISRTQFAKNSVAYDMFYANKPTAFLRRAIEFGAGQTTDGIGMLVEQAAESFYQWHNIRPNTKSVIDILRN